MSRGYERWEVLGKGHIRALITCATNETLKDEAKKQLIMGKLHCKRSDLHPSPPCEEAICAPSLSPAYNVVHSA
jgi:hypothetical protein